MNIPIAKPLCDMHSNICYYIKQKNTQLNNKQCHQLEHLINHAESPKEITDALLTKMVRQTNIQTVLRLMCLFSVTQSGLKQDAFELLKKTFLLEYGFHETATLCNMEVAGLFRMRDKALDWSDIKEVSFLVRGVGNWLLFRGSNLLRKTSTLGSRRATHTCMVVSSPYRSSLLRPFLRRKDSRISVADVSLKPMRDPI